MPPMIKPSVKKAAAKKAAARIPSKPAISPEGLKLYKLADKAGVDPRAFAGQSRWLLKWAGYKIAPSQKTIDEAVKYERQETARLRSRVIALGGEWR